MEPIDQGPREQLDREQVAQAAAVLRSSAQQNLGDFRRSILVKAALLAILGICALFWPGTSMAFLVRLVGAFCIADGISSIIQARRAVNGQSYWGEAIVSLLIGAVLLFWPGSAKILLLLFGAWMLYTGIRSFFLSRQLDAADPERSTLQLIGIIASVVGLVLLLWPGAGVATLSWLIGIAALVIAGLMIFGATRMKQLGTQVRELRR